MDRKLSAIVAADVVGYSALMDRDAAGAFERVRAGRKELFEPEIALHRTVAAIVGVFALLVAGAFAWYGLQRPPPTIREPSIAVLPFANMSGDPAQDYLGSGIAEDIITMLSSFPTLRVVSRTSSFVYDKPVKVQQVGEDLKVSYVLEGSVRKTGDKMRVTALLIDALTGDHVWADRYDEEGSDVAALQDDVANKLYGTLAGLRGEVMKKEEAEAWSKSAPSLEEYDYYLRGHQLFFRFNKEDNAKARPSLAGRIGEVSRLGTAVDENSVYLLSGHHHFGELARHGAEVDVRKSPRDEYIGEAQVQ
jgi:TolB-like protein